MNGDFLKRIIRDLRVCCQNAVYQQPDNQQRRHNNDGVDSSKREMLRNPVIELISSGKILSILKGCSALYFGRFLLFLGSTEERPSGSGK